MRISSKGRYAVATLTYMAKMQEELELISAVRVATDLGISKIYLEQVFSLLKKSKIISSVKGSSGGYRLARPAEEITAYEVLCATELGLFEETERTLSKNAFYIDDAISRTLWKRLDAETKRLLLTITIKEIAESANDYDENMYYI